MNLWLVIYAVNFFGNLSALLGIVGVLGAIFFAVYGFIWMMCENDRYTDSIKPVIHNWFKAAFKVWLFLIILFVFVPDRPTMILMSSAAIGEKILDNPKVTEVVDPSIDLLKTWMVKQNKELQDSMKDKKEK